jgi:DNA-binding MarR family transcriptional regulator
MANEAAVRELMDSFRRIVHALRSSHRAAAYLNATGAQLFILTTLRESDRPLSITELAARTRTDQSTVSKVLVRLVQRGLVTRRRSSDDQRRVELSLTPRGRALQKRVPAIPAQKKLLESLQKLGTRDAAVFVRIMKEIVRAMGVADEPAKMMFDDEERVKSRPRRRSE